MQLISVFLCLRIPQENDISDPDLLKMKSIIETPITNGFVKCIRELNDTSDIKLLYKGMKM